MKRALLLLCAAGVLLAACGGKGTVRQPATLEPIDDPRVTIAVDWRNARGPDMRGLALGLGVDRHQDAVFTADARGNVYALNPENGSEIWRARTGARLSAGPSVEGDTIYVGTLDAEVIALSRADGEERWRSAVASEVLAAPISDGRHVAVRTIDGRMTVLDASDGRQRWTSSRSVPPLILRGASAPIIVGPALIYGLDTGRVVAKQIENGEPIWEQVVSVPSGRTELERIADINAPLVAADETLYVMSYGGDIAALDIFSGDVRWRRSVRSYSGAVVDGDRVYVSDEAGKVWALDVSNGAAAWTSEALSWRGLSAPAMHAGHVVVTDFEGYVHYLSPSTGDIVGRVQPLRDRPAIGPQRMNGKLLVADVSGRIAVLSAESR